MESPEVLVVEHLRAAGDTFPNIFMDEDLQKSVEMLDETLPGAAAAAAGAPHVKRDWYQTESHVVVTVMAKNVSQDGASVRFLDKEATADIRLASGESLQLRLLLLHAIVPQESSFRVLSTKVELKMKKADALRWQQLEGRGQDLGVGVDAAQQPPSSSSSSSSSARKWDKMAVDIGEEEKKEKLEGDAALKRLFQQIYSGGSDEVKRAMNKSFMESSGTVLSTDWQDVGSRTVEVKPPDGLEPKKY